VYDDVFVSKNFAKTLDLKREFDVTVWRHKQRTPSNNDFHTPLLLLFLRRGLSVRLSL